jgi:hypothetical protein
MWLPPSTSAASAALAAAAERLPPPAADAWIADLAASPEEELIVVTWANRPFWRCQLGAPALTGCLVELARELDVLPAVVSWPALLLASRPPAEIHAAWERVMDGRQQVAEGIVVVPCDHQWGHCGAVTAAMRALATHEARPAGRKGHGCRSRAVFELPEGRLRGRWAPTVSTEKPPAGGWLAIPADETEAGYRWRLQSEGEEDRWAEDLLDSSALGEDVPRVPGWLAAELGPGRPAALLVARLAEAAGRAGVPLWVPNVDRDALQHLLRLPGAFWVDGSAVPEPD